MSATESFEAYAASLTEKERASIRPALVARRTDLMAARSEEARVRIAEDAIREIRDLLRGQRRG